MDNNQLIINSYMEKQMKAIMGYIKQEGDIALAGTKNKKILTSDQLYRIKKNAMEKAFDKYENLVTKDDLCDRNGKVILSADDKKAWLDDVRKHFTETNEFDRNEMNVRLRDARLEKDHSYERTYGLEEEEEAEIDFD